MNKLFGLAWVTLVAAEKVGCLIGVGNKYDHKAEQCIGSLTLHLT